LWDALISTSARRFIDGLSPSERGEWEDALWAFLSRPLPGDAVELGFPYPPGTFGYSTDKFWFTFTVINSQTLGIAGVMYAPS